MDFVDEECFDDWKRKGYCLGVDDFLVTIKYKSIKEKASHSIGDFLTMAEVIVNFIMLAEHKQKTTNQYAFDEEFFLLKEIILDGLTRYNQRVVYDDELEQALIIEDKPEVTAVAEIAEPQIARAVIRYNHHTLKGDIDAKKAILLMLASELEPQRRLLKSINSELEDSIFYMLNNMNLRHNNTEIGDKNYHKAVAEMGPKELEQWYDELYQMMLLAKLLIDNKPRQEKTKMLKAGLSEKPSHETKN